MALEEPAGVAVDRRGNAFVADRAANLIQVFSTSGFLLKSIGLSFSPTGIDLDEESGFISVADGLGKVVAIFDLCSPAFNSLF